MSSKDRNDANAPYTAKRIPSPVEDTRGAFDHLGDFDPAGSADADKLGRAHAVMPAPPHQAVSRTRDRGFLDSDSGAFWLYAPGDSVAAVEEVQHAAQHREREQADLQGGHPRPDRDVAVAVEELQAKAQQ
jgi:hypothetical protein